MLDSERPDSEQGQRPSFCVYRAKKVPRTYLVVSISRNESGIDHVELADGFENRNCLDDLEAELKEAFEKRPPDNRIPITLMVHGFNTRRGAFEQQVLLDSDPGLYCDAGIRKRLGKDFDYANAAFRGRDGFYIGYFWPSEGLLTWGSIKDSWRAFWFTPLIGLAMVVLPILAGVWQALGSKHNSIISFLKATVPAIYPALASVAKAVGFLFLPYGIAAIATVLLGFGTLLVGLRLSTYLRDRYRALHYGVPDFGEFMRALEGRLTKNNIKVRIDVIGHSMGTLLLINALRVMSDYFSPEKEHETHSIGRDGSIGLGSLILCAADIPAAMVTVDYNNYFLSALRRFESVHALGNDRDIILKWLSSFANWISEPRFDLAGRRLGNVMLVRRAKGPPPGDSRHEWTLWPVTRPIFRHFMLFEADPARGKNKAELMLYDFSLDERLSAENATMLLMGLAVVTLTSTLLLLHQKADALWLLGMSVLFGVVGTIARFVIKQTRDIPRIRAVVGFFADLPTLLAFLPWCYSNPHGGYFLLGGHARAQIARILCESRDRAPTMASTEGSDEKTGARWRKVVIAV